MANIYVIDDDEQLLRMVGFILERGGHTAKLFSTPQQALEQMELRTPDLIIVDIMMPHMSGHEVMQAIRTSKKTADIPILTLSARSQPVDRETALRSGATGFLSKPLSPDELLDQIRELLNQPAGGGQAAAPLRPTWVISLAGLRGGTGRTTLAVNLAAALLRASQGKICIWDLSPSGSQAALHFRLQPKRHWSSLLDAHEMPKAEHVSDFLLRHQSGIQLLAAPPLPQSPDTPAAKQARAILAALKDQFDFVVIDCPPVMSPAVVAILSRSDLVLDVVTPELISVQQAAQTTRSLAMAGISLPQKAYVLNHVSPGGLKTSVVERGLGAKVAFRVGFDQSQANALTQGKPLCLSNSQSPLTTIMLQMGKRIDERVMQGAQATTSAS